MKNKRLGYMRVFNSRRLMLTALLTAFFCSPVYLISRPDGTLIELRRTGGSFPDESNCTNFGCHAGTVNSGPGSLTVTANGMPLNEFQYSPGETVPIVVTVAQAGQQRWGFQATARTENGCSKAGELAASNMEVLIRSDASRPAACPEEGYVGPQFAMHSFAKGGGSSGTFEFNWTAPAEDIGPVRFAVAGNAANGNNLNTGDNIYTIEATLQPADVEPTPMPSISEGGIVLATLTPLVTSISANSIITIFGQNFAPAGTFREPGAGDLVDGRVPTQLAGTCVEVGGQRAPLFFVSPLQLNVQAPTIDALGPVGIEVIRDCGSPQEQRSGLQMAMAAAVTPAFFIKGASPDGRNAIAALHLDFSLIGDPARVPGGTPAAPGEIISLFATGFGPTEPAYEAGEIPQQVSPENPIGNVRGEVTASMAGMPIPPADIFYAGVAPCCAGLYQVVLRVPQGLASGDHPVVVTVDGVTTPDGPFVTVAGSAAAPAPEPEDPYDYESTAAAER